MSSLIVRIKLLQKMMIMYMIVVDI